MQSTQGFSEQVSSEHVPLVSHVLVVGAKPIITKEYERYAKDLDVYNKRLRDLTNNRFVVRQTHKSNGKTYHGRYVNERYWCKTDRRIKQRYFGKAFPEKEIEGKERTKRLPSAPINPLEGLECQVVGENVIMPSVMYDRFYTLFKGAFVVPIAGGIINDN